MPVNAGQTHLSFRPTTRSSHAIWRIGKAGHTLGFDDGIRTPDTLRQNIQSQPLIARPGGTDASSRKTSRPTSQSGPAAPAGLADALPHWCAFHDPVAVTFCINRTDF
jgi:hypothetical protein